MNNFNNSTTQQLNNSTTQQFSISTTQQSTLFRNRHQGRARIKEILQITKTVYALRRERYCKKYAWAELASR